MHYLNPNLIYVLAFMQMVFLMMVIVVLMQWAMNR
jgi:hypothetical protein